MTAIEKCLEQGLTLVKMAELTGVSRQTLANWSGNKPLLFDIVLIGCKYKKK
jgi:transcriptional regulator with XRE-family HTH domain